MKHVSTYLKRLKFDENLLKSFVAKYIQNLRLIILIVLGISLFGIISYSSLPRDLYPSVNIPMIYVTTVIPGANPNDVESLVTIPVEDSVNSVSHVKTITSSSYESVSSVAVEFDSGVDLEKAKTDVQSAVDSLNNLPQSAQKSTVTKIDLQKTPIWTFSLVGSGDRASLIRFAKRLGQDLKDLKNIDDVQLSGIEDQEVQIVVKPEAVSTFNVNPQQLIGAVKTALNTFPAGNVDTQASTFSLTINPQVTNIDDIRNLKVNLQGQVVSISDIADVLEISKPGQYPAYIADKNQTLPAVNFNVFRVTTVNIGTANKDAQDLINKELKQTNGQFKVLNITNYAQMITDQFNELGKDLVETILLVAVVLFIFLGARQAFVALLATPLTFAISFIVMNLTGISLNFISVFALLLSLGLLVDDTIVVVSAITAYFRSGKFTPMQAGLLVWRDFIAAITTTTTTTIWAFLPILISTGIIGEFIKPIPIVVSTTLAGSFFVAMFITLPFIIFLLKPTFPKRVKLLFKIIGALTFVIVSFVLLPKNALLILEFFSLVAFIVVTFLVRKDLLTYLSKKSRIKITKEQKLKYQEFFTSGILSFQKIEYFYSRFIHRILNSQAARRKVLIMVIIFSVFSFLLVPLGFVKNEFFPKANSDTLSISVELPSGTNLYTTRTEALKILNDLSKTPETDYVMLNLGSGYNPFGGGVSTENIFNYTLVFKDKNKRKLTSSDIAELLRQKYINYNTGKLSVNEESGGPPTGADVQIKIFGSDLTTLNGYATKVEDFLKDQPGVTNVDRSIKSGTSKIVFAPNEQEMANYGLTADTTGLWLRLFATGVKIDSIKLDPNVNTSEDITLRLNSKTSDAQNISEVSIPTQTKGVVPITSLGDLSLQPNPTLITREGGKRTISITASVKKGYTVPAVNAKLESFANGQLNLASGYSWATGGVNEENQNSVTSVLKAMFISIILIVITMVLQFSSFRKAFIVISVIPLATSGVFIIFGITQTALTFPALVGVLALFGIVVKNSILVVDKITANIKTGMEFKESIADAASSRLEPIALTSVTAIVGLIPITLSDPLWRGLGGAIISGLMFSGTIMLIFIPVIYYVIFNPSNKK